MVPNQVDARPFAGAMLLNWGVSKGFQASLSGALRHPER